MAKKEKVPTTKPVQTFKEVNEPVFHDDWQDFLHWVYCPDGPGKCKCSKPQ